MGRDGVEYFSVRLVFVEAVVDEVAQITSALGAPPGVGVGDAASSSLPDARGFGFAGAVFRFEAQERNQVAHDGEAQA